MICLTSKPSQKISPRIGNSLSILYNNAKRKKKKITEKILFKEKKSRRLNKKQKEGFLTALVTNIKKDPTSSIRKSDNEFNVHEKAMRKSIKKRFKTKIVCQA